MSFAVHAFLDVQEGCDSEIVAGLGFSFARAVLLLLSRLTPNRENRDLSHEGQMISTAGKEGGTRERGARREEPPRGERRESEEEPRRSGAGRGEIT